jgi:drug/metabolite transporter (DMT)-like permease
MEDGAPGKRGTLLAAAAALLFGVTAPLLKRASVGTGPLVAGALLYLGAAAGAAAWTLLRRREGEARSLLAPRPLARLVGVALVGGALAPVLLVAGLRRTDGATASLLLALEAPFTLVLARLALGEHLGRRIVVAALLVFAGATTLVAGALGGAGSSVTMAGALLVAAAALAWAVDNLLSRPLAEYETAAVVVGKGLLGAAASAAAALLAGEARPELGAAWRIALIGALGYGVSLQLYLGAQRLVGAGRTASVFASAPFLGVVVALALGAPWPGATLPIAGALVGVGVWLHLSERHAHPHRHETLAHEHVHTHDDGHHAHHHDPMTAGAHSHAHEHETVEHAHAHSEDVHHRHRH